MMRDSWKNKQNYIPKSELQLGANTSGDTNMGKSADCHRSVWQSSAQPSQLGLHRLQSAWHHKTSRFDVGLEMEQWFLVCWDGNPECSYSFISNRKLIDAFEQWSSEKGKGRLAKAHENAGRMRRHSIPYRTTLRICRFAAHKNDSCSNDGRTYHGLTSNVPCLYLMS